MLHIIVDEKEAARDCNISDFRLIDTQEKTSHVIGKAVVLNINPRKTKTMHLNYKKNDPLSVCGNELEDIEAFA